MRRGFIFCRPDDPAGGGATPADSPAPPADPPVDDPPAGKTFTQDELGAIVKRERAAAERAAKARFDDEAKRAAMSAEERLRAELEAERKNSADAATRANAVLVRAEAKVAAAAAGAAGENAEAVIKLADLGSIEVGEDGAVDAKAVEAAVTQVKGKFPALFAPAGAQRSGGDFQGGEPGRRVYTEAQIAAMTSAEFAAAQEDINAAMAEPGRPRLRSA